LTPWYSHVIPFSRGKYGFVTLAVNAPAGAAARASVTPAAAIAIVALRIAVLL
jgi:hypothetical protein